jgi:hypothetical protein
MHERTERPLKIYRKFSTALAFNEAFNGEPVRTGSQILEPETNGLGNPFGFENIHDLGDIDLDVRRGVTIKEKE